MRHVAVLGAPSSIGLRPHHETGTPQEVDRAPETLRGLRLVERLDATDFGDVLPPPYADLERLPGKARNEAGVSSYSRSLADRVAACLGDVGFPSSSEAIAASCSAVSSARLGPVATPVVPVAKRVSTEAGSGSRMSTRTPILRARRSR